MYQWCAYCGNFVRSENMSDITRSRQPYICRDCAVAIHPKHLHLLKLEAKRVRAHVNRAVSLGAPATLTIEQWFSCLDYWEYKCAVCGNPHRRGMDHWKNLGSERGGVWYPIGTIATNVWAICQTCNVKKRVFEPDYWLMGIDESGGKLAAVLQYFDWIKLPPLERPIPEWLHGSTYNERLRASLDNYKLVVHKKLHSKRRRQNEISKEDRQRAIEKIKPFVGDSPA